jgi:Leucine-rich repeat (LRR) protein
VTTVNLSANNLADPTALKELVNISHLDLGKNKIKNVNVFITGESF